MISVSWKWLRSATFIASVSLPVAQLHALPAFLPSQAVSEESGAVAEPWSEAVSAESLTDADLRLVTQGLPSVAPGLAAEPKATAPFQAPVSQPAVSIAVAPAEAVALDQPTVEASPRNADFSDNVEPPIPPNEAVVQGLPAELEDFDLMFRAAHMDPQAACREQGALRESGRRIAAAPVFEMTTRNLDSWRSGVRELADRLEVLGEGCEASPRDDEAISELIGQIGQVWKHLMQTRG